MKNLAQLLIMLLSLIPISPVLGAEENDTGLEALRWKSRITISQLPQSEQEQRTLFNSLSAQQLALEERLLTYHTVLIGLDGGSKASYESLVLSEIFRDIDGMPMRRSQR
jgi:hypothetical protein